MLHTILFVIWFILPIAFANMAPIFAAALPGLRRWDLPMDGDRKFRNRQVFGPHKTWRGLVSGIIIATLVLWLQQFLVRHLDWAASLSQEISYTTLPTLLLGPAFGLGA